MATADPRARAAERALAAAGVAGARVRAAGQQGEIAVIELPPAHWDALLGGGGGRLVTEVKALGFRYVALDLEGGE